MKPFRDFFTPIQHRKNQTAIGKPSHRILVTIHYFHKIPIGFLDLKTLLKHLESDL